MTEPIPDYLFEVETPLGFKVRTTTEYWEIITTIKHPVMKNRLDDVQKALTNPDEIRQSKSDEQVLLFYKADAKRWVCAVVKRLNGEGFLITAYTPDTIKEGKHLWNR